MLSLQQAVLSIFLVLTIRENHAQTVVDPIQFIPHVTEQVIKVGTELKLTCMVGPIRTWKTGYIFWEFPDGLVKDQGVS